MFKRLTGFVLGYLFGLVSSWYLVRRVRARFGRYTPPAVATRVGRGVTSARHTVTAAVADGRTAMQQREAELHADLAPSVSARR